MGNLLLALPELERRVVEVVERRRRKERNDRSRNMMHDTFVLGTAKSDILFTLSRQTDSKHLTVTSTTLSTPGILLGKGSRRQSPHCYMINRMHTCGAVDEHHPEPKSI